jgi:uracil-DNA glycosylase
MPVRTFPDRHLVCALFEEMSFVEPYPSGVLAVPQQIPGSNFFPGGAGVWCGDATIVPPLPVGEVMVLGQDFHTLAGYNDVLNQATESFSDPTWRNLLQLLDRVPIERSHCFFTNVYMGLREADSATGPFAGSSNDGFVYRCRRYFLRQLATQKPRLLLALGQPVLEFLAPLSPDLKAWERPAGTFRKRDKAGNSLIPKARFAGASLECAIVSLLHPCFRPSNLRHRRWRGLEGDSAELALIRDGKDAAGLS